MQRTDALAYVRAFIPETQGDRDQLADITLQRAMLKFGRLDNVKFNRRDINITLTSGTSSYNLGSDLVAWLGEITNISNLYVTDDEGSPITVVDIGEFNSYARGSTTTGTPQLATIHSNDNTIEFWPIPDANTNVWGYVKVPVTDWDSIPTGQQDLVLDFALGLLHSSMSTPGAINAMDEAKEDAQDEGLIAWRGSRIKIERSIGAPSESVKPDSGNLRP